MADGRERDEQDDREGDQRQKILASASHSIYLSKEVYRTDVSLTIVRTNRYNGRKLAQQCIVSPQYFFT